MARPAADVALGDTNVFVALFATPDHPLHGRALSLFRRVAAGELVLVLTPVIVAELAHVLTRVLGWPRRKAADTLRQLADADGLRTVEGETLRLALDLFAQKGRLAFADTYLAARALDAGPAAIATFDRALASVPGVRIIDA